jgi:hypothetical protein
MLAGNTKVSYGAYDLLETEILTGSQGEITFSSLGDYSSDYKHFQIRIAARSIRSSTSSDFYLRFNADTGANYAQHYMRGDGSAMESAALQTSGTQGVRVYQGLTGATSGTGTYAASVIDILDPFDTNKNTTIRVLTGFTGAINRVLLESGLWMNTDAITSITFDEYYGSSFAADTRISLYGLKGA